MKWGIINLGMGNLKSLCSWLKREDIEAVVLDSPAQITSDITLLILPGVGNFSAAVDALDKAEWRSFILNWVKEDNWLVGICLGMQLMCRHSAEGKGKKGLELFSQDVKEIMPKSGFPVPHMGWNTLLFDNKTNNKRPDPAWVYFVHGLGIEENENTIATVEYTQIWSAIMQKDNVLGYQFHPEKSGEFGKQLLKDLKNSVEMTNDYSYSSN